MFLVSVLKCFHKSVTTLIHSIPVMYIKVNFYKHNVEGRMVVDNRCQSMDYLYITIDVCNYPCCVVLYTETFYYPSVKIRNNSMYFTVTHTFQ